MESVLAPRSSRVQPTTAPDVPHPGPVDRVQALLSIAAADALGSTTEFLTPPAARRAAPEPGIFLGGGAFDWAPGEATDDSQMIVASLLRQVPGQPFSVDLAADGMRAWLAGNPPDVGGMTRAGLRLGGAEALRRAHPGSDEGNGSLMRAAALWLAGGDAEQAAELSAVTHAAPLCVESCVAYTRALYRLEQGHRSGPAYRPEDFSEVVAQALQAGLDQRVASAQSGWVIHTLQNAVAAFPAPDWTSAIHGIVQRGDDSDTTAVVAAGVLAACGLYAPQELQSRVRLGASWADWDRQTLLADVADRLVAP